MSHSFTEELSIAAIERRYSDEWILIEVTKSDKLKRPLFGRVLAHSQNRRDLVKLNRTFCEENPGKVTYVFFAGAIAPEGYTIIV
jgi:hypothetical protein